MSRLRRLVIRLGKVVAVLVALLVVAHTVATIVTGRQLARELQRLKAAGEPLTLAEAAPKPVPDRENAAILYQQAFDKAPRVSSDDWRRLLAFTSGIPPKAEPSTTSAGGSRAGVTALPTGDEISTVLKRYGQAIALTEAAARRPKCVFPVHWEWGVAALFPHIDRMSRLARLLHAKARILAAQGRPGDALEVCATMLRLADHLRAEPDLLSQGARLGIQREAASAVGQVLAGSSPSSGECRAMFEAIASVDNSAAMPTALAGERAVFYFEAQRLRSRKGLARGPITVRGLVQGFPLWLYTTYPGRPMFNADLTRFLRATSAEIEQASKPYWLVTKLQPALTRPIEYRQPGFWDAFWFPMSSVARVFIQARPSVDQANAQLRLAQVALATYVYRLEKGVYPGSLADLRRVVGWPLPEDPFSGKPFVYRRKDSTYLLYSIGPDLKDDGGRQLTLFGWPRTGDIVWRVAR